MTFRKDKTVSEIPHWLEAPPPVMTNTARTAEPSCSYTAATRLALAKEARGAIGTARTPRVNRIFN